MSHEQQSYADNLYRAEIIRIIDGDTWELVVDLGQAVKIQGHYRLARLDAPEVKLYRGVTPEEKAAGIKLKEDLEIWLADQDLIIQTHKSGKYGRFLIEAWGYIDSEYVNINDWLIEKGLAVEA